MRPIMGRHRIPQMFLQDCWSNILLTRRCSGCWIYYPAHIYSAVLHVFLTWTSGPEENLQTELCLFCVSSELTGCIQREKNSWPGIRRLQEVPLWIMHAARQTQDRRVINSPGSPLNLFWNSLSMLTCQINLWVDEKKLTDLQYLSCFFS